MKPSCRIFGKGETFKALQYIEGSRSWTIDNGKVTHMLRMSGPRGVFLLKSHFQLIRKEKKGIEHGWLLSNLVL
jgi:hypothetical protein